MKHTIKTKIKYKTQNDKENV